MKIFLYSINNLHKHIIFILNEVHKSSDILKYKIKRLKESCTNFSYQQ